MPVSRPAYFPPAPAAAGGESRTWAAPGRERGQHARERLTAAALLTPLLLVLLPLAFYLALFHPATLDIGNAGWLIRGTDNGENALGAHAYWHDARAGASLWTGLLNAPDGVPLLFTDSNPLATLVAKPFAAWLPADAQLVGPILLANLILQALFAWLLLRRHAPGAIALWAGVVLLAFPPTLANRFIHVNLMAHWTILAALWLALDPGRAARWRWWAALIVVTALIHNYLLAMVGILWGAVLLDRFVQGSWRARAGIVAQGAAMLAIVAVVAHWLGVGDQMPTEFYGAFAVPVDGLWHPHANGVSRLFDTLTGPAPYDPAQWYEGFQYLGAGGLLLVGAAWLIARRRPASDAAQRTTRRLRLLVPALGLLAILSVWSAPLPTALLHALDPVRASGRLFWPVGYALILLALLAVYRLPARAAGALLAGLVAVQAIDLAPMARGIRTASADAATHRLYVRTTDPRWDALVRAATSVAFMPGQPPRDLSLYQEVAWRAVDAGRPVTSVYAARTGRRTAERLARERRAFDHGALVPGRLYVLLRTASPPAGVTPLILDGVPVIAPRP